MKTKVIAGLVCALVVCAVGAAIALDVPALKGRVNDYAGMLAPETVQQLDRTLGEFERAESTQIVVLIIPTLAGDTIEDFSIRVAESWKIGQKKRDNGAILLIAKDDRKMRIEVGYGLEGKLTDAMSGRIISSVITPSFREGKYDEGVTRGVDAMISVVKGEFEGQGLPEGIGRPGKQGSQKWFTVGLFLLILLGVIGSFNRIISGVGGAILGPLFGAFGIGLGMIGILALIPLGFGLGMLLPSLLRGAGHGGFIGGGGGGFSSGGGGGGFSGGGGGFGGGGASGGW